MLTSKQLSTYENALTAYAQGRGERYLVHAGLLTKWAAICGKTADEVLRDLEARMSVKAEDAARIRRGMKSAAIKYGAEAAMECRYRPTVHKVRRGLPYIVEKYIRAGGGDAVLADLRRASPVDVSRLSSADQTAAFLSALWKPDELLFVKSHKDERGVIGSNILPRAQWTAEKLEGRDTLYRNPLLGTMGKTSEGKDSFTSADCIATARYALLEFDHLPPRQQAAFWLGFLREYPEPKRLRSLVWSGHRSIHGMLEINATGETDERWKSHLKEYFAASTNVLHIADEMGFNPHGGTRLAGATRIHDGRTRLQELLFLRPVFG